MLQVGAGRRKCKEASEIHKFSTVVLLAAKEYNREDHDGEEIRDGGIRFNPVNKITSETKDTQETKSSSEMKEGETGSNDKNVEAAWTSRPMSTKRRKTTFCMTWFAVFEFLGNIVCTISKM